MPAEIIYLINQRAERDGNDLDVNVEMRIGGYPIDEVINDQEFDLDIPEQRIDPGPPVLDDQERIEVENGLDLEDLDRNVEDVFEPDLDDRVDDDV